MDQDVAELLSELDDEAKALKPRLFALYGVFRGDEHTYLGWGMEFDEPRKAVMWSDGETWHSDSAAQILETHQLFSETRLIWLDASTATDYDLAGT
jgi:hypothetical protein